jgi:hypothetical protein
MSEAIRVTRDHARAAAIAAQALPQVQGATITSALESAGFLRTVGGVEAYLALRARVPGVTRAAVDAALASGEAAVVQAVRGCMYVVARRDVPLALAAADLVTSARAARELEKAGVKKGELEKVGAAVLAALKKGPLSTDALRKSLAPGVVRNLGEAGKKVGITSPLPAALRRLELDGRISRVSESSGLDTERYVWRLASAGAANRPRDAAETAARLAELFLRAAAIGTVADFAEWAGLGKKDANAALDAAGAVPASIEGEHTSYRMLPSSKELFARDAKDVVAFLGFEDNLVALHGGPAFLVDAEHHELEMPSWGRGRTSGLAAARHLALRTFVANGRIAGLWELDADEGEVVVAPFVALPPKLRARVDAAAKETAAFLLKDVGHGRSFSLDTDDDARKRVAAVRKLKPR